MLNGVQGFGGMPPMGGMGPSQALTEDQKQTLQEILEEYEGEELTAETAKEIFKAFQEAGIRGPGLREAVKEAGMNADELFSLAHGGQKPPAPPSGGAQSTGQVNLSSLQTLQSILEQFDLTSMSSEQEKNLLSQLNQAGLMGTGGVIDIST
jgi:hypothetical protein